MVWLGSEMAFGCCTRNIPSNSVEGHILFLDGNAEHESYVLLQQGIFYPMRIVLATESQNAQILMSMDFPSQTITDDWSNYVFLGSNGADLCASGDTLTTITHANIAGTFYWTGSSTFTSTYVFTTTDSSNVVHILAQSAEVVPQPSLFTTDVPSTTSVETEYTAIDTTLGATPYLTTRTIVLVPTSTIFETTAGTFYWTGASTFTSTYVFTTTDSSNVVYDYSASALVLPLPSVLTTDVPSTTSVVTEYVVIDTALSIEGYVTTLTVVLVPRSSATPSSTSDTTTSDTTTSDTTTFGTTSATSTPTSESTTLTTSGTTSTSTSETTTSGATSSGTTSTTSTSTSETTTLTTTPTTTPTTTAFEVSYPLYVWTGTSTRTLTLTYINDELYVPATGLFKRADNTSFSTVVLIPTPSYWAFADGQSVGVLNFPELLPNGQTATIPLTLSNPAYFPWLTNSNIPAPTDSYTTVTTTSTGLLPTTVTSIVTTINAEGSTVTEVVVIIVKDQSLSTITTFGTQATTFTSVYTERDGKLTSDTIVFEVPANGTRTITVPGTTTYTTTSLCTTTNAAGATLTIADVVVYCPEDDYHKPHVATAHDTTVIDKVTEVINTSCITYTDDHGILTSCTTTITEYVVVPKTLTGPTTYTYPVSSINPAETSHSKLQQSRPVEITFEGAGNYLQGLDIGAAVAVIFAFVLL